MKTPAYLLRQSTAATLAIFLAAPLGLQAQQPDPGQQVATPVTQPAAPQSAGPAGQPLAQATKALPADPATADPQPSSGAQLSNRQDASESQQSGPSEPVGTAAAPYEKPFGVAASRPAGAVIAPAKQRRARSILIRVGLIVGAAAAIGTVVALSESSSSRPQ